MIKGTGFPVPFLCGCVITVLERHEIKNNTERFYIQSALSIADPGKKEQEIESLKRIPDSFSKTVVVRDYLKPWQDENGITYVGIEQFLLNEDLLK